MAHSRLLTITGLAVAGALCAGTAATAYSAALPRQLQHAAVWREANGSESAITASADGAEPDAVELRRLAADRRAPFADRLRTAHVLAVGACLNPREVLFGAQAARQASLDALADRLADLSQAATAVAAARTVLQAFDEAVPVWSATRPEVHAGPSAAAPRFSRPLPDPLPWLVPEKVLRRVELCRTLLAE